MSLKSFIVYKHCASPRSVYNALDFFSELCYTAVLDNNNQRDLEGFRDYLEGFIDYYTYNCQHNTTQNYIF